MIENIMKRNDTNKEQLEQKYLNTFCNSWTEKEIDNLIVDMNDYCDKLNKILEINIE